MKIHTAGFWSTASFYLQISDGCRKHQLRPGGRHEQRKNRMSESRQNHLEEKLVNQDVSWSGRQDSNLHQPIEIATGDSDKPPRNRGEPRVKRPRDSDSRHHLTALRILAAIATTIAGLVVLGVLSLRQILECVRPRSTRR